MALLMKEITFIQIVRAGMACCFVGLISCNKEHIGQPYELKSIASAEFDSVDFISTRVVNGGVGMICRFRKDGNLALAGFGQPDGSKITLTSNVYDVFDSRGCIRNDGSGLSWDLYELMGDHSLEGKFRFKELVLCSLRSKELNWAELNKNEIRSEYFRKWTLSEANEAAKKIAVGSLIREVREHLQPVDIRIHLTGQDGGLKELYQISKDLVVILPFKVESSKEINQDPHRTRAIGPWLDLWRGAVLVESVRVVKIRDDEKLNVKMAMDLVSGSIKE
jgi:hypothetical protein